MLGCCRPLTAQLHPTPADAVIVLDQPFIQPTEIAPVEFHGAIMTQPTHICNDVP
jgi:hypothetical protein